MKPLLRIIPLLLICSCATTPSKPEYKASEVIERIGGKDKTPDWASGETAMYEERGNVVFINSITMAGNSRPDACLKVVDLDARTSMLRHIKDNITTSGQVDEASAADDASFQSLTAFLSQGSVQGAKVDSRYWEKVEESDESGERILRVKCAVKLSVKKTELARQLRQATGNQGNPEMRKKLIEAQGNFIESLSSKEDLAH